MRIQIDVDERYPVFRPVTDPEDYAWSESRPLFEVDRATLQRWQDAEAMWGHAQREMHDLADPPCPECHHRASRHQEWSREWDNWACLACKTCRHGCPPERLRELEARET